MFRIMHPMRSKCWSFLWRSEKRRPKTGCHTGSDSNKPGDSQYWRFGYQTLTGTKMILNPSTSNQYLSCNGHPGNEFPIQPDTPSPWLFSIVSSIAVTPRTLPRLYNIVQSPFSSGMKYNHIETLSRHQSYTLCGSFQGTRPTPWSHIHRPGRSTRYWLYPASIHNGIEDIH